MKLILGSILLLATTALGQGTRCPQSSEFRVRSVLNNATNVNATSSFGWIKSIWWYSDRYYAILDPSDSWLLATAYVTDIYNHTASQLEFPDEYFEHSLGLLLNPLSKETPADFVEIKGQERIGIVPGTEGVYYDDAGKIQYIGPDGQKVKWHGCPNRDFKDSNVTQLGYRLHNATVPGGCYDLDLVMEYEDGWNTPTGLPPKCWDLDYRRSMRTRRKIRIYLR